MPPPENNPKGHILPSNTKIMRHALFDVRGGGIIYLEGGIRITAGGPGGHRNSDDFQK